MVVRRLITLALLLFSAAPAPQPSRYLFVWGMESTGPFVSMGAPLTLGRDFLAVFDIEPGSSAFGSLVAMLPVGSGAMMAHHTNYEMPSDGILFANDFMSGDSFIFNLRDPAHPKLAGTFAGAGPFTQAHSFVRLANGNTLATYQYTGPKAQEAAGGLAEIDSSGHVLRTSNAADPSVESFIRPYSLAVVPKLDRVVTGSSEMPPSVGNSHVVQVWRLSDLKLLKTVVLPKPAQFSNAVAQNADEPRLLSDGVTVLVPTGACGLYRINDLAGTNPSAQFVYDFGYRACGVPVVIGRYWVEANMGGHGLTSLDVSDPSHPVEAGHITLKGNAVVHWISHEPGGNRIAITGFGWISTHVLFATIDPNTGALALDARDISFDRKWPDGWDGTAIPHGTVFGNQ